MPGVFLAILFFTVPSKKLSRDVTYKNIKVFHPCRKSKISYFSLYLRMYLVLINVSSWLPGLHLQLRSLVFRDQHVMLTGFSGGTVHRIKMKGKLVWIFENTLAWSIKVLTLSRKCSQTRKPSKLKLLFCNLTLTTDIKARSGQNFSVSTVTNQVVPRLLQWTIELM